MVSFPAFHKGFRDRLCDNEGTNKGGPDAEFAPLAGPRRLIGVAVAQILPPPLHETFNRPAWADAFWARFSPNDQGCWLWTGATNSGYGQFYGSTWNTARTHRIAYMWTHGPIPYGRVIDHLCRVTQCGNPAHLEAVTERENILRGVGSPAQNARADKCVKGHPLEGANLIPGKLALGERQCRTCNLERTRQNHYKRPTESPNAGPCAECGRILHVRKDGLLHKHLRVDRSPCPGSGERPGRAA